MSSASSLSSYMSEVSYSGVFKLSARSPTHSSNVDAGGRGKHIEASHGAL